MDNLRNYQARRRWKHSMKVLLLPFPLPLLPGGLPVQPAVQDPAGREPGGAGEPWGGQPPGARQPPGQPRARGAGGAPRPPRRQGEGSPDFRGMEPPDRPIHSSALHTGLRCPTGHVYVFMVTPAYTSRSIAKTLQESTSTHCAPSRQLSKLECPKITETFGKNI